MVGVGALLGDVGAHMGLVMRGGGSFQLLGCLIALVFGSEVVGHDSVAFGIVSLVNRAVMGLGSVAVLVAVPGFLRLQVGFHVHTDIA